MANTQYTEKQLKIISGEIPFDKVHTNELIAIYQKARNNKDDVLADLVFDEISERRRKANQKEKSNKKRRNKLRQFLDGFDDYDPNIPLSKFGQALLKGAVDIFECSEEKIVKLIEQLAELNDEKNLKIASQLLSYKRDITILYPTKDHWEAIDKIEELLIISNLPHPILPCNNLAENTNGIKRMSHISHRLVHRVFGN